MIPSISRDKYFWWACIQKDTQTTHHNGVQTIPTSTGGFWRWTDVGRSSGEPVEEWSHDKHVTTESLFLHLEYRLLLPPPSTIELERGGRISQRCVLYQSAIPTGERGRWWEVGGSHRAGERQVLQQHLLVFHREQTILMDVHKGRRLSRMPIHWLREKEGWRY